MICAGSSTSGAGISLVFSAALQMIGDHAALAFRLARLAAIAPVQDQPVMRVVEVVIGDDLHQLVLDLVRGFPRCQTEPVGDAEDMGVDRHGRLAKGHRQHHVGGLAADAGQGDQLFAGARHLAAEFGDQLFAECDDVLRLVAVKPDGLDIFA
jgi:hypothetical protein